MFTVNNRLQIPREEFEFTFARSSGPGGQNVNKVNSKATLRWQPAVNKSLPPDVLERFVARYRSRITAEGDLLITSQRYRDQPSNIDDCLAKLGEMLLAVAEKPKPRRPVKMSKKAKRKRLESKRHQSAKKQGRGRFSSDE
ncbi:MAG: aminoacyl-tRNA hydrolase [Planctomycetaceae bacterium]|nr:aminoacyl-tRNA hydrolase [Planctomycetaceae bacterium]